MEYFMLAVMMFGSSGEPVGNLLVEKDFSGCIKDYREILQEVQSKDGDHLYAYCINGADGVVITMTPTTQKGTNGQNAED